MTDQNTIQNLKCEGKFAEAGALARSLNLPRQYGQHFGMRSSRERAIAAFNAGYDADPSNAQQEQITVDTTAAPAYTLDLGQLNATAHVTLEQATTYADANDTLLVATMEDLAPLSGPQLIAMFNTVKSAQLPEVKKFASKEAGQKRVWGALQAMPITVAQTQEERNEIAELDEASRDLPDLMDGRTPAEVAAGLPASTEVMVDDTTSVQAEMEHVVTNRQTEAAGTEVKSEVVAKAARKGTGITLAPKAKVYPCRAGSKQATLVDMLFREQGATMAELLDALKDGTPWKEVTVKSGLNWDMNKVKGYGIRTTKRGEVDCYHLVLPAGMDAPLPHTERKGK